ncbi:hypothetical protein DM01DRAFT_1378334 [Hesseltinella vesiculosa]|uniref:Uncharacterized protein n=1 Tax=Hesseltinella vesiculosa TaxID=101127 RepID=A0A1X2G4G2_9FUNG|nr:hypothetical protein DM01DRAFT_1378334 [Hesseltinella vesiculosa]
MTSRNFGRLFNAASERFIGRQNVEGNNNFPLTEPHPRLIQSTTATAPLAHCSDCKSNRALIEFEGRRCWYRTCIRCRNKATEQRTPPSEAMINWDEFSEFYSQFSENTNLPINMHLPDELVGVPVDTIIRRLIVYIYEVSGFDFYLANIYNPSKRKAVSFKASCTNSSIFQRQRPESELQRLHDRIMTADCNGRLIGFVDEQQRWIHCTLHHDDNSHPLDTPLRGSVDGQIRRAIHNLAPHRSPVDVYDEISRVYSVPALTYTQTYYWYNQALERYYRSEDNALRSALHLIRLHGTDNNFGQLAA